MKQSNQSHNYNIVNNFFDICLYIVHNSPNAAYPQQTYNAGPVGGVYPGSQGFAPTHGQQAPVINNFYGQPQSGGSFGGSSGGSSLLGTALAAGAGAVAGNALYGALKPDSEQKTVIIHENSNAAPPSSLPPASPPGKLSYIIF